MKPESEQRGVGNTLERTRPSGALRGQCRAFRLVLGCSLVSLSACPQLLDDEFTNARPEDLDVYGDAGGSSGAGVGGGAGEGGSNSGSAGTNGGGAADQAIVLGTTPVDGSSGVLPDTALIFLFGSPMDTASVEAAYSSTDLPRESVSFSWTQGDTVLNVQPDAPLQAAAGTDADDVVATRYAVALSSEAKDKLGHALVATQLSFSVARSITQTLQAVQDRDLTGHWRSDDSYGIADCERVDTTICTGDGALSDETDPVYKGLITFALSSVPGDAMAVTQAELSLVVSKMFNAPFTDLRTLQVERVEFSSIGDAAFAAPALSTRQLMSSGAGVGERMAVGVLADVQADWAARLQNQYRLSFETPTDEDDEPDTLICDWSSAMLRLTYWLP